AARLESLQVSHARDVRSSKQELQNVRQPPRPVGLGGAVALGLDVAKRGPPVSLAAQEPRKCACIAYGAAPFLRAGVEIDAAARSTRRLDVLQQSSSAEPDRRAQRARASEGRAGQKEREQADQTTHRRTEDRAAVAMASRPVLRVDARLDGVDQEPAVAPAEPAAKLRVFERAVFGETSRSRVMNA